MSKRQFRKRDLRQAAFVLLTESQASACMKTCSSLFAQDVQDLKQHQLHQIQ